jgi:hypothetical protein
MTYCYLCLSSSRLQPIRTLMLHLTLVRMFSDSLTHGVNSMFPGNGYPTINGNTSATEELAIERTCV